MEVDFLLSNQSKTKPKPKVFPVEVKSSKNITTTSLSIFREVFSKRVGGAYVVHPKGYSEEEGVVKLPPYMLPIMLEGRPSC